MLFSYILAFLKVLEDRIQSGEIHKDMFPVVITHEQRLAEDVMKKSREKLRELQAILGKIGSLRNGRGGDLFFKGLMKSF